MSRAAQSEIPTKAGRIAALLLNRQKSTAPRARATEALPSRRRGNYGDSL